MRRRAEAWFAHGKRLLVLAGGIVCLCLQPLPAAPTAGDEHMLVRDVIANEIQAESNSRNLWSYKARKRQDGKELLFAYCETREGTIHRLLAVNGDPLNAHDERAEDERIQRLVSSPEAVHEAQKKERADAERERQFLRLFPDAFVYHEQGRQGDLVTLVFSPNPQFRPSGYEAKTLQALEGKMVIDAREKRLASVSGRLTQEVKFWGGLLGHINQGGTFAVSLMKVAPDDWELKSLEVNMHGKALLFKTISVQQHETYSGYTPVPPDTTLASAARRLKDQPM